MGKKTQNGLYLFDQYQMEKYEKIEFDMNTIDSALWKKAIQRNGIYFDHVDTSRVTERLISIFINETLSDIYDNKLGKVKRI
jgi:hypothetical protein